MALKFPAYLFLVGIIQVCIIGCVDSLGDCRLLREYGGFCQYRCHCVQSSECEGTCSSGCEHNFHGDLCTLSKVFLKQLFRSDRANRYHLEDGDINTGSFINPDNNKAWVRVELNKKIRIQAVKLWKLKYFGGTGSRQFKILTRIGSDYRDNRECNVFNATGDIDQITCRVPTEADVIVLRQDDGPRKIMYLTEIEILGCSDGSFGDSCENTCRCSGQRDVCDKDTGECPNGCAQGYTGSDCQQKCPSGNFGFGCQKICHCQGICSHVDGFCNGTCRMGYQGGDCQSECVEGTFGGGCLNNCHCIGKCSKVNGVCNGICRSGYHGDDCQSKCVPGTFGSGCKKTCRCAESVTCDRITGECLGDCASGYKGYNCQDECTPGFFGPSCHNTCNCLNSGDVCDTVDGTCAVGCATGFVGLGCLKPCGDGRFGINCAQKCNCLETTEACNKTTGECLVGCATGYSGLDCQKASLNENNNGCASPSGWIAGLVILAIVLLVGGGYIFIRECKIIKGSEPLKEIPDSELADLKNNIQEDDVNVDTQETVYANVDRTPASDYPVKVTDLLQYVQTNQANGQLKSQFESLPKDLLYSIDAASLPENRVKCRYRNIAPYDYNRVILQEIENEAGSDFINASFIAGFHGEIACIAAQGPTAVTLNDFWRMVWETNCGKILMLSKLVESAKKKVELYWPVDGDKVTFGDLTVELVGVTDLADYCTRTLHVTKASESRTIYQFQFKSWPDHDRPSDSMTLLEFRNLVNETHTDLSGFNIVHCSAGVGRTGTYILLDFLLDTLSQDTSIDVYSSTRHLRLQRPQCVQTLAQYIFIHQALAEGSLCLGSIISLDQKLECLPSDLHRETKGLALLARKVDVTSFGTASLPENIGKHRNTSAMAEDVHRVILSRRKAGGGDYINAVFIPTMTSKYGLIATQVPLSNTVSDFWAMLQQQQSSVIVTLYADSQLNDVTIYPDIGKVLDLENVTITTVSVDQSDTLAYVRLKVQHQTSDVSHDYLLIRLLDWPETRSFPLSPQHLVQIKTVAEAHIALNPAGPVTVVCRNGKERCALFCSLWNTLDRFSLQQKLSQMISVKLVQNVLPESVSEDGYRFLYSVMMEFLGKNAGHDEQIYTNQISVTMEA